MNILYTANVHTIGGREGHATSNDKHLDVKLSTVKELGGPGGEGTNPEQLFAAGYSACFLSAIKYVARQEKIDIPADSAIDADVSVGPVPTGFALDIELRVSLPGVDRTQAQNLVDKAHIVCPYSHSLRGNVDVRLVLVNEK